MFVGVVGGPPAGKVDFNVVENQHLFSSDDLLEEKAQDYLEAEFQPGYSIQKAILALTDAGAICSYKVDPQDPTYYFCDYSRPGHGLGHFYEQIDWAISIDFNTDKKTVKRINVIRYESSL